MKAIGSVLGFIASPVLAIGKAIAGSGKTPALPAPLPVPTLDTARQTIAASDALRRRRGGAADIVTGSGGAEAGAGSVGKATLGS